jgi:hypothetical protein
MMRADGEVAPMSGPLAAQIALLHVCEPEYGDGSNLRLVQTDSFTIWNATGDRVRGLLKREGDVIRCPELGTQYPSSGVITLYTATCTSGDGDELRVALMARLAARGTVNSRWRWDLLLIKCCT